MALNGQLTERKRMKSTPMTADEVARELNLPSGDTVRTLARNRKIPVVKIGYRTHRYDLENVRAALAKYEVRAL